MEIAIVAKKMADGSYVFETWDSDTGNLIAQNLSEEYVKEVFRQQARKELNKVTAELLEKQQQMSKEEFVTLRKQMSQKVRDIVEGKMNEAKEKIEEAKKRA